MLSKYNFNLKPYYDDFDETKGFYRILFKPGFAVQARELSQIQTQIQNQISKFGDNIFTDGSIVIGGNSSYTPVKYVNVLTLGIPSISLVGKTFVGVTSGAIGKIVSITVGTTTSQIFFSYLNGLSFVQNENIIIDTNYNTSIVNTTIYSGTASSYSIQESVFFVNGFFVYCEPQTVIMSIDKPATVIVGLVITENIINSSMDTSLLDPALGSYNYSAPGADRYNISLTLTAFDFDPSLSQQVNNTDFIELTRYVSGSQVTLTNTPIYSVLDDTLARRTFDEAGNYTVSPFKIKILPHIFGNNSLLSVQIDAGRCYVQGYEFVTIAPTYIDLPKARTTIEKTGYPLFVDYGKYLLINSLSGDLDYTGNKVVNLCNSLSSANVIGNCVIKSISYNSFDGANNIYTLFIDSVNFAANGSIANVVSISNTSLGFQANISSSSYTSNNVVLTNNDNSSYILTIPKENIETLILSTQSNTEYQSIKRFTSVSFTSNGSFTNATLTNPISNQYFIGGGYLGSNDTKVGFLVTVSSNSGSGPAAGTVLTYDNGLRVNVVNANNLQISYPGGYNFVVSIVANIAISSAVQKTKLLTTGQVIVPAASVNNTISLGIADCFALSSVKATSNTGIVYDYTNSYSFFNGQTDTLYDFGSITLNPGAINPVIDRANIANVTINFSYFAHSGSGFCSVDSYTNSGISYTQIPSYTASNGTLFNLEDCLDFRPIRTNLGIDGSLMAKPSSMTYVDFEYYIGRIDKLVVTKEKKFSLVQGIPSDSPIVPTDIPNSMDLYVLNIAPYTNTENDVSYKFIENKRYTMRDIGAIENRVARLEYYTALSLLEKQASDENIPSTIPTIDLFKNGILVDSFAGHSVGDVYNPDYKCSIDYVNKVLRPPFFSSSYTFNYNSGTNCILSGNLVTLDYTTEILTSQSLASDFVNLNPYNVFLWTGYLSLVPSIDNWVDITTAPDVVTNVNGENDVYAAKNSNNPASVGVRWNDWGTIINGVSKGTAIEVATNSGNTSTVTTQLNQVGSAISTSSMQTTTQSIGNQVVDSSIIPYMRSRLVDFIATGLKPSTQVFASFDGIDVTSYCTPATEITLNTTINPNVTSLVLSTNSNITANIIFSSQNTCFVHVLNSNTSINYSGPHSFSSGNTVYNIVDGSSIGSSLITNVIQNNNLITDSTGSIAGTFLIPNSDLIKFRTGTRLFSLSDIVGSGATTTASTTYVAEGLAEYVPVVSVVPPTSPTVPVPPPPSPPEVPCSTTLQNTGTQGNFTQTIVFGTGIGSCGINFNNNKIPDRYTITWNGTSYTTGFVGDSSYNNDLNKLGYPNVTGSTSNFLRFNKTSAYPTTAIIQIDAPLALTQWAANVVCPNVVDTSIPLPNSNPINYVLNLSGTSVTQITTLNPNTLAVSDIATIPISINVSGGTDPNFKGKVTLTIDDPNTQFSFDPIIHHILTPGYGPWYADYNPSITVTVDNNGNAIVPLTFTRHTTGSNFSISISGVVNEVNSVNTPTGLTAITNLTVSVTSNGLEYGHKIDPVAETFFVDSKQYSNGVFIDSVDLFFRTKSNTIPVMFELRPTVNGYPSSDKIIPLSNVTVQPKDVLTSTDASIATNFKFESPIYLAPGEYAFVAKCNTDEYTIYTATIGNYVLNDPTTRITQQPSIGSMFESQNASTWTANQNADVKFVIHKCIFDTSNTGTTILSTDFNSGGDIQYDVFYTIGKTINFAPTSINYFFKTSDVNGVLDSSYTSYQLGSNYNLPNRSQIRNGLGTDLLFRFDMTTSDSNISPVVDLSSLSNVLVQNIINNGILRNQDFITITNGVGYNSNATVSITGPNSSPASAVGVYDANTGRINILVTTHGNGYTGNVEAVLSGGGASVQSTVNVANEFNPTGGNARARYITRKVTLASGFESYDLKVYLLGNLPSSTSIQVYYKVAPVTSVFFEQQPWQSMVIESSGSPSADGFVEYKYKTPNNLALLSGDQFNMFAIKIAMYSSDKTKVPQIKDLRVIALDD